MRLCTLHVLIMASLLWSSGGCRDSEPARHKRVITQTETPPSTGVKVVAWRSVRTHATGPLAIEIGPDASGMPMSEPRAGGVTGVEIEFDGPVKLMDPRAVSARTDDAAIAPTSVALSRPNLLVMKFEGLREGHCYSLSIAGAITGLSGTTECRVRCLEGDVNSDGRVDNADVQTIKQRAGKAVRADTARFDLDRQGDRITLTDVLRARSLEGHAARCK